MLIKLNLQRFATPSTSQVSIDLTTLSGWGNVADGKHSIQVVAKADGYKDSEKSTAVSFTKAPQVYTDCLTFTGETSEFTLNATNKEWDGTLEWSIDHTTWTTLIGTEAIQSVNKKLYLRGKGNTTFRNSNGIRWQLSAKAGCSGNIQTLLDWENPPTSISSNYCYRRMFYYCTNLTTAPELPATILSNYCYEEMFLSCTNLTTTPELPATTLKSGCYQKMFNYCSKLTSAPKLPATTLARSCYEDMFYGCANLTTAPELPATTLANRCYMSMFKDCSKLKVNIASGTKIFTCPSTIASYAVDNMFSGTGGTFTGTPTAGNTYYWTA